MAYRRRQLGITRASTFKEEIHYPLPDDESSSSSHSPSSPSPSLAAQAIRASAAHRNSSNLSSAYGDSVFQSSFGERPKVPSSPSPSLSLAAQAIRASAAHRNSSYLSSAYGDSVFQSSFGERPKDSSTYENTSMKSSNESKGFWGILAEKAKAILEDDDACQQFESPSRTRPQLLNTSTGSQPYQSPESSRKVDNPRFQKGLDALTSSLNHIGDTIGNALEEGRTIVENKTSDIMHETRKLQIRRRGGSSEEQNQVSSAYNPWQQQLSVQSTQPQMQTNKQNQLKASRDVAMATAAKAKLLLRELKTVKADLTFAKERSAQLEDENRILREACDKGDNPADDDMIRLQLETLLAEKGRLAHENSVYARENRLLREIVEYHQLTMQDVVYLDEGIEEVTEVYPIPAVSRMLSISPPSPISPCSLPEIYQTEAQTSSSTISPAQDSMRRSNASS